MAMRTHIKERMEVEEDFPDEQGRGEREGWRETLNQEECIIEVTGGEILRIDISLS